MSLPKTRLFLVEDQELQRQSLVSLLNGNSSPVEIVSWAPTVEQMLEMLEATHGKVQLILMDVRLSEGEMDGFEGTTQVKNLYPALKVIILSEWHSRQYIAKAVQAGANGYISKYKGKDALLDGIISAMTGGFPIFVPEDDGGGDPPPPPPPDPEQGPDLTDTERKILCLIVNGKTSDQISGIVDLTTANVNRHRRNLITKFKVSGTPELTAKAVRLGYCRD